MQSRRVCNCIDRRNLNARSPRVELISVILYLCGRDDKRARNGQVANVRTISSFRSIHLSQEGGGEERGGGGGWTTNPPLWRRKRTTSRVHRDGELGTDVRACIGRNSRDSLTDDAFVSPPPLRAGDLRPRQDTPHVLIYAYIHIGATADSKSKRINICALASPFLASPMFSGRINLTPHAQEITRCERGARDRFPIEYSSDKNCAKWSKTILRGTI